MRRHFHILAVLVVAALTITPSLAQKGHGGRHHSFQGAETSMHERLFSRLDLSEIQRERIERMMADHRESVAELVERERETRAAVVDQMHAEDFDEGAIREAVYEAAEAHADVAVERARLHQRIRQELTDEQRARMDEMLEHRRSFMEHGRGYHNGEHFRPLEPRSKGPDTN